MQRFFSFHCNVDSKRLIILAKAPRPGTVKTRLARDLGADQACAAYRQIVAKLFSELDGLKSVEIRFTPGDAREEVTPWQRPGWRLTPQGSGDLGQRLQTAFADAFEAGFKRVVAIGSDCPTLTAGDVESSWAALDNYDAVIGPALDGGYWLIALRAPCPELFQGISWSTADVLPQTVSRAKAAGLKVKLLRERRDIDSAADWEEFVKNSAA
jgi:rSAM/selenodomain-associated transferase 1